MPKILAMEVDLFDNGADHAARPAWQVIEAARRRYLTGQLVLETTPPTHVYLRDGQVYFAERTTDGGLGVRLLVEGVITREQMHRATLQVSGVEHLGRMFERDDSIDREAVQLCVELMTDDVLTHVSDVQVATWRMKMYQRHPSGLDRWVPTRVEVITHLVDSPAAVDPEVVATPAPAPRPRPQLAPPPVTSEVRMPPPAGYEPPAEAVAATPVVAQPPAPSIEMPVVVPPSPPTTTTASVAAVPDVVPDVVPQFVAAAATSGPDAASLPMTTLNLPVFTAANPTGSMPAVPATNGNTLERPPAGLAPSAMDALMSGSIKDEVAEAVRRALASIDG
jgi:hypothetical protein